MTSEITDLLIAQPAARIFGANLCWNHTDAGVVVKDGDKIVCEVATRFASRDGLRIIDAIRAAGAGYHLQTSDHGCGCKSVQVFAADGSFVTDVNLEE